MIICKIACFLRVDFSLRFQIQFGTYEIAESQILSQEISNMRVKQALHRFKWLLRCRIIHQYSTKRPLYRLNMRQKFARKSRYVLILFQIDFIGHQTLGINLDKIELKGHIILEVFDDDRIWVTLSFIEWVLLESTNQRRSSDLSSRSWN